ncbi:MAG: N-acetylglucosamine-6-phosphate deacetylase [Candidatus Aureabacteria bacterium]|nr:N-acetylglucosamine-6-phosphate deacetylase [Candidatus Auribacterota bacterium]
MKNCIIKNVLLHNSKKWLKGEVKIKDGYISEVGFNQVKEKVKRKTNIPVIDGKGNMLMPGMIDIHFHGIDKIDLCTPEIKSIESIEKKMLKKGVTGFLATFYSLSYSKLKKNLIFYREYLQKRKGKTIILGVNLEGPFLNKKQSGAHERNLLTDFSDKKYIELIKEYKDIIKVITLSPELSKANKYIKLFTGWGIKVMIGHTLSTFHQSEQAVLSGAAGITHFYNRITPFHHREVGVMGTVFLNRSVFVELIADGIHSSPEALQMLFNSVDDDRIILVSDMIMSGGSTHKIKGVQGCFAYANKKNIFVGGGSHLINIIKNITKSLDIDVKRVWRFVSINPASMLGLKKRIGCIKKGMKADMILMDEELIIKNVFKAGEKICVA